ncbi:MAG TPA: DEAD/DEAH box helicase [Acidimicrobiia bacterium]|nr:DEAD/DEAH box helicase [Acidimicrobiia bacterium]
MSTTPTFEALGVSAPLVAALAKQDIIEPFAIQTLALPDAFAGLDVCGKAKTGSGKTLAFGLPLLERIGQAAPHRPRALVLVPTRELANQVKQVLAPLGKICERRVKAMYGGVSIEPQITALGKGVDVVIGTPGRLIDLMERGELSFSEIEVLVLDEADRMADMGFMPQVQKILHKIVSEHQTMLFSATLDGAIDRLVQRYLNDPVYHEIEGRDATVEEMTHRFLLVHQMDRVKVAAAIARNSGRTLVFTRTKRGADRLVTQLRREGVRAGAIHGDLRQAARESALADFGSGKVPVLVATDVAARGLHIDDIDVVVHYDPPEDHKTYVHRSGRTARAGASGVAVTLMLYNQENEIRVIQRRLSLDLPIVEVFSNDPRLEDLHAFGAETEAVAGSAA